MFRMPGARVKWDIDGVVCSWRLVPGTWSTFGTWPWSFDSKENQDRIRDCIDAKLLDVGCAAGEFRTGEIHISGNFYSQPYGTAHCLHFIIDKFCNKTVLIKIINIY